VPHANIAHFATLGWGFDPLGPPGLKPYFTFPSASRNFSNFDLLILLLAGNSLVKARGGWADGPLNGVRDFCDFAWLCGLQVISHRGRCPVSVQNTRPQRRVHGQPVSLRCQARLLHLSCRTDPYSTRNIESRERRTDARVPRAPKAAFRNCVASALHRSRDPRGSDPSPAAKSPRLEATWACLS
jgi:hypothetical protein